MSKITVKEIQIGPDGKIPLFDEELEGVSGGLVLPRGTMFYQWKCRMPGCLCASEWYDDGSECHSNLGSHILETGHSLYDFFTKYLD